MLAAPAARTAALFGLCALGACGPIEYINQVPIKASSALEEAELAEAGKYAPYHYTRAVEYLRKAREEVADADYQAANRFGRKSEEAARRARELSLQRAASGEDGAVGPPESAPPVKDESGDEVPPGLGGSRGEP